MSRGRKLTMMLQVKFSRSCMENSTLYYARTDGPFSTVISHFRIKNRKFPQSSLKRFVSVRLESAAIPSGHEPL